MSVEQRSTLLNQLDEHPVHSTFNLTSAYYVHNNIIIYDQLYKICMANTSVKLAPTVLEPGAGLYHQLGSSNMITVTLAPTVLEPATVKKH